MVLTSYFRFSFSQELKTSLFGCDGFEGLGFGGFTVSFVPPWGMGDSTGLSCGCQGDVGDMSAISLGRSEAAFSMMCWRRLEDQAVTQCSLPSNGPRSCHIQFLSILGPSLQEAPVVLPLGTSLCLGDLSWTNCLWSALVENRVWLL